MEDYAVAAISSNALIMKHSGEKVVVRDERHQSCTLLRSSPGRTPTLLTSVPFQGEYHVNGSKASSPRA